MNEQAINLFLQRFSCDFLDWLNLVVTNVGDELFFIAVAVVVFWCFDKKFGYRLVNVYLLSSALTSGIKHVVRRPRPFEDGTVPSIGEKTSGYSFPSGHSASIANLSTLIAVKTKKKSLCITGAALTLIVMITRIYLGQHYLSDVVCGCIFGICFALLFNYLYGFIGDKEEKLAYFVSPACVIAFIVAAVISVTSAKTYAVCGGLFAVPIAYNLEKKYVALNVKTTVSKQIIKVLSGGAATFAVLIGLKYLFITIGISSFPIAEFIRYALTGFTAFLFVPYLFNKFGLCESQKDSALDGEKLQNDNEVK